MSKNMYVFSKTLTFYFLKTLLIRSDNQSWGVQHPIASQTVTALSPTAL